MDDLRRKLNWLKSIQSKQKGGRRKRKQFGGKRRRKQIGGRRKQKGRGIPKSIKRPM